MVDTGIFKSPVDEPVMLRRFNLEGDKQADRKVHGNLHKAVYFYTVEHYTYWRQELPDTEFSYGMFGENFTIEGITEADVHVGDILKTSDAEILVSQPRFPCYKLGIRFGRPDMVKRFLGSRRSGFYGAVLKEGMVAAGQRLDIIHRETNSISIADFVRIYAFEKNDVVTLHRAIATPALPEDWREYFRRQLEQLNHPESL